jgi:hypothetical protein
MLSDALVVIVLNIPPLVGAVDPVVEVENKEGGCKEGTIERTRLKQRGQSGLKSKTNKEEDGDSIWFHCKEEKAVVVFAYVFFFFFVLCFVLICVYIILICSFVCLSNIAFSLLSEQTKPNNNNNTRQRTNYNKRITKQTHSSIGCPLILVSLFSLIAFHNKLL